MLRTRRLPGLRFEVQAPPHSDLLPRLDVACFVGFAASGPLHLPVCVSSIAEFEMIFGNDLRLAWDSARGEQVYAYLAPAVRAFFRNGGRLAWIIRVAGDAKISYFPVLGLLEAEFDEGVFQKMRPAYAQARTAGSWADTLRVSTSLLSHSIDLEQIDAVSLQFQATLSSLKDLAVGDLLRITFETGALLMCTVQSIESIEGSPIARNQYHVTCDHAVWFRLIWDHLPSTSTGFACTFDHDGVELEIPVSIPYKKDSPAELDWPSIGDASSIVLDYGSSHAPELGSLLRVDLGGEQVWMRVEDVGATDPVASPAIDTDTLRLRGQAVWWIPAPFSLTDSIDFAERLSFELWTRAGEENLARISDLTFDPRHPRYWDALPTDLQLYTTDSVRRKREQTMIWSEVNDPRFALAGQGRHYVMFIPLAIPPTPDRYLAAELPNGDRLTRDGLSHFNAGLFLDRDLLETCVRDLIGEADTLRYQTHEPRSLMGIHAALDLEEVSLLAVPDAIHRGWIRREPDAVADPIPSEPLERIDWWHFLDCDPKPVIRRTRQPEWGNFLNCDLRVIEPPCFFSISRESEGTFTLAWMSSEMEPTFLLEEATRNDFKDAVLIYEGPDDHFTFYGHTQGIYYYRVRVLIGDQSSDWSEGVVIRVAATERWLMREPNPDSDAILQTIQHSVLRLCAARGDVFAVLALPEHYREDKALEYIQTLTTDASGFCGPEEPRTLSYGAVFHPWLIGREENLPNEFRRTPPDGAITGMIARRTLARGAWLAPANEFLKGVVSLTPAIDRKFLQGFQDFQINLIRQEPKGFVVLNNDTLTSDPDLRPINVRRLLILLRRLALQLGPSYVFEPNDTVFRRAVQRTFESVLDDLFRRGAFAGGTAATSYQVVTDASINTPQLVDQGRLMVELKVAPSLPLSFLTIRLVQTGDRTLIMQEV